MLLLCTDVFEGSIHLFFSFNIYFLTFLWRVTCNYVYIRYIELTCVILLFNIYLLRFLRMLRRQFLYCSLVKGAFSGMRGLFQLILASLFDIFLWYSSLGGSVQSLRLVDKKKENRKHTCLEQFLKLI